MGAAIIRRLWVCLWMGGLALGQQMQEWERFEVFAHLRNDGAVDVTETLTARVNGKASVLDRPLAHCSGHHVVIRQLAAVENGGLRPIGDYTWDGYVLQWPIREEQAPEWNDQTLTFRLEYALEGALRPAWDLPAGTDPLLSRDRFPHFWARWREWIDAWREPRGRYRFDHDVLFARFESEGPGRLDYTFKYDTAWKHPRPELPLQARVTPGVSYRVTELRDYLSEGTPAAVTLWKSKVRAGSVVALGAGALVLWLAFAIREIAHRGLFGRRIDRDWWREHFEDRPAELVARRAGKVYRTHGAALLLERWRRRAILAFSLKREGQPEDEPVVQLRRLSTRVPLARHETAVLQRLLPGREAVTSAELAQLHARDGFDLREALDEAISDSMEDQGDTSDRRPRAAAVPTSGVLGKPAVAMLLAAAILILLEAFRSDYTDTVKVALYLAGALAASAAVCVLVPQPMGGLGRALLVLVPIVVAVCGGLSAQLQHTLPLLPEGSAGFSLLALSGAAGSLALHRRVHAFADSEEEEIALAQRAARAELRKAAPELEDAWLPQLFALGCGPDLDRWRARAESDPASLRSDDAASNLRAAAGPAFTGRFSLDEELEWASLLTVPAGEHADEDGRQTGQFS